MTHPRAATVGQLKETGYQPCSVKDELRRNLIKKLRAGEELFPGILGYRDTVVPQIVNGILSKHDMLLLGLRGQAKTRILRMLPDLLDEWMPALAGTEINDDPIRPTTRTGKRLIVEHGDDAPIEWVHRKDRYKEKLATPDVTIADLIGEIDLVKHAEGRYLSDESTMHFGLIPRSNRGIFAINELPDLAPRIQVGLFNVLEERDVQIRGYPIRLDLDVFLVFSANPEDYTNRGRIVTPLKDRIGSVIRTHYPESLDESIKIAEDNAWTAREAGESGSGVKVEVPRFMSEIVEEVVRLARSSPHVSQASGVSVRTSIANLETLISNSERRGLTTGEGEVVPRICDLNFLTASCRGKIEMTLSEEEGAEEKLLKSLIGEAVKKVFGRYADENDYEPIVEQFKGNLTFPAGDDLSGEEFVANMKAVKTLPQSAAQLAKELKLNPNDAGMLASVGEFLLEGLYVNNRLSKYSGKGKTFFKK
ncbi:sigma 54-interacting transcriptional regulator [Humisphaera borealis]|uniref:Sigma 54-interacting transcriptional regulator n=1 Tax=Humisphaera borealis TaxID=2807512 RepID=A0A7M2X0E0_9BACT|nr:sigma 54-interacting transcriptional regulator [Humisphaera borealis]QOV91124.1 sigma 54-interacting transcriptional regulator [Humisphaera borealis]